MVQEYGGGRGREAASAQPCEAFDEEAPPDFAVAREAAVKLAASSHGFDPACERWKYGGAATHA